MKNNIGLIRDVSICLAIVLLSTAVLLWTFNRTPVYRFDNGGTVYQCR